MHVIAKQIVWALAAAAVLLLDLFSPRKPRVNSLSMNFAILKRLCEVRQFIGSSSGPGELT